MDALIPSPHLIAFEKLTISGPEMMIEAKTTRTVVHCPDCQQPTQKVHSSYLRHPRDLPTAGLSVRLLLHTRKFFCENTGVQRQLHFHPYRVASGKNLNEIALTTILSAAYISTASRAFSSPGFREKF